MKPRLKALNKVYLINPAKRLPVMELKLSKQEIESTEIILHEVDGEYSAYKYIWYDEDEDALIFSEIRAVKIERAADKVTVGLYGKFEALYQEQN